MYVNKNFMPSVLFYIGTLVRWVVTLMEANADPNENKSKMLIFLREIACLCVRMWSFKALSSNLLILREGDLVYQKVLEQMSPNYCQS